MDAIDRRVAQCFEAFESRDDPSLLYPAWDAIREAGNVVDASGSPVAGRRLLSRCLRFFSRLDVHIDPGWRPDPAPPRVVEPPAQHGVVYPSGEVDPSAIPDPMARAHYEQARRTVREQRRRYSVQFELRRIDERAMRMAGMMLGAMLAAAPAERRRFERLLAASSVAGTRRQRLRSLLRGR